MSGNLSFADLKTTVSNGEIDTVLVCMVDMQGRLMGKRFLAQHFADVSVPTLMDARLGEIAQVFDSGHAFRDHFARVVVVQLCQVESAPFCNGRAFLQ